MDGGGMSKPTVNPQPQMKFMQETQGLQQNVGNNMSQQSVGAVQQMREGENASSTEGYKAQEFLQRSLNDNIEASGGGQALMQVGAITQSPSKNQFLSDLAAGASQAEALSGNPNMSSDLSQFAGESRIEMGEGGQTAQGFGGPNLAGKMGMEQGNTAQVFGGGYGYNNSGRNSYGYNQYHSAPRNSTPLPRRSRYQDSGYGGSSRGGHGLSMDRSYGGGW